MKIVHISTNSPYNEGWGYQENLLTKYQKRNGHDVTLIVSTIQNEDGKRVNVAECEYDSESGVHIIRRNQVPSKLPMLRNVLISLDVYDLLVKLAPDFIFYHGLISTTIFQVKKYKKNVNPMCRVIMDNHMDYNIGYDKKRGLNDRLRIMIYRAVYKSINLTVEKVYGVTPWRRDYVVDVFGVPEKKAEVLIMGADDDKVRLGEKNEIRKRIREKFSVKEDEFLVVSGGKLDTSKKILPLMKAVNDIPNVKLLLFGDVAPEIKEEFESLLCDRILFVGWIPADEVYGYFFASDLVCFPGQHSVLWEQACASKVPCLFAKWPRMNHIDNGGNSMFIDFPDVLHIKEKLESLIFTEEYNKMKKLAESSITDIYLYSRIAESSVQ